MTADGRHHTFAQFGSGSFTPGVRTHLSRFVLVDPLALAAEATHLAAVGVPDALDRLTIDRHALLATPYHRPANRARELARGQDRHGSCGMGVGETVRYALDHPADAPRVADCAAPRTLARSLCRLRGRLTEELGPVAGPDVPDLCDAYRAFAERVPLVDGGYLGRLLRAGPIVFEGAQGVLLDEWRGFHPYTTWSTTTFANAETLLAEAGQAAVRLGVVRCYMTRHGPGPFVTEDPTLEFPEPHNRHGAWQGAFRIGHPDAVALRYAVEVVGGVDAVALTHLDVALRSMAGRHPLRLCRAYQADGQRLARIVPGPERDLRWQERLTRMLLRAQPVYDDPGCDGGRNWPGIFEEVLGAPVILRSYGPAADDQRGATGAHTPMAPRG
jgi:adenylosuccinate synthase